MSIFLSLLYALGALFLAVANLSAMRRDRGIKNAGADWGARRRKALAVRPEEMGDAVAPGDPYGVLMEVATPGTTLTLAAFADGRASLYSSAGGDALEGVGHDAVREAARALVAEAKAHQKTMKPVSDCPRPGFGNVRFNIISGKGILAVEEDEEALDKGWSPLSGLYQAGVRTMQALRQPPGQAG